MSEFLSELSESKFQTGLGIDGSGPAMHSAMCTPARYVLAPEESAESDRRPPAVLVHGPIEIQTEIQTEFRQNSDRSLKSADSEVETKIRLKESRNGPMRPANQWGE